MENPIPDFEGELTDLQKKFIRELLGVGYEYKIIGSAKETVTFWRDGKKCGYINKSVNRVKGIIGFTFPNNIHSSPYEKESETKAWFGKNYSCVDNDYAIQGKKESNKIKFYLVILNRKLAETVFNVRKNWSTKDYLPRNNVDKTVNSDLGTLQKDIDHSAKSTLVEDLNSILGKKIDFTTKEALVSARVGQGRFRRQVLELWGNCCAITCSKTLDAIKASHIKPWRESSDNERLDPSNGLPLVASLDALFDTGLISFESSGKLIVSSRLNARERQIYGLAGQSLAKKPIAKTSKYLDFHREYVLRK